jgi:hypothetical protein
MIATTKLMFPSPWLLQVFIYLQFFASYMFFLEAQIINLNLVYILSFQVVCILFIQNPWSVRLIVYPLQKFNTHNSTLKNHERIDEM